MCQMSTLTLLHEMDEWLESSFENDGGMRFVVRSLFSAFS